ncbi:5-formyltetrahydrofolate cyclo-ligase [Candidatus Chlamydia sanziniae]|uniref:5-formyltetrahydrofolate cyclo-ligase n=1 Tax=Candidatus Chlamydia sanziniae TaxID=1806891 RepID=A0A1A9HUQ7_9CHLA|nr:5-formyltetrahydrofolate cyclo-ligase [Candidatus Chlamydia sanziniae]ANH78565.1 5-formyltetrahydrofolate cyclo-ligase [Candidatus Chlamydia sanziniae]
MTNLKTEKTELRKTFTSLRRNLSTQRVRTAAVAMTTFVQSFPSKSIVLSFASCNSEIDMNAANHVLAQKFTLALPQVCGKYFFPVHVPSLEILATLSSRQTMVPHLKEIPSNKITHVLVPGLAFDQQKYRLGYGKGFYDRWLDDHPHLLSIGVGYVEQNINVLPRESHDIPLSQVYLC